MQSIPDETREEGIGNEEGRKCKVGKVRSRWLQLLPSHFEDAKLEVLIPSIFSRSNSLCQLRVQALVTSLVDQMEEW